MDERSHSDVVRGHLWSLLWLLGVAGGLLLGLRVLWRAPGERGLSVVQASARARADRSARAVVRWYRRIPLVWRRRPSATSPTVGAIIIVVIVPEERSPVPPEEWKVVWTAGA